MSDKLLPVKDAINTIISTVKPMSAERVNIQDSTGRVLYEDIISARDIPAFNNSAMDGFAVLSSDTEGADEGRPKTLRVVDDIPAGKMPERKINKGECARIMTGGIMPEGADAVVMVEFTEEISRKEILVKKGVKKNENVRLMAEDIRSGSVVLKGGTTIRGQEVGLLAAIGRSSIMVYRRPRCAILSTGSEIVNLDEPLSPGRVIDSNSYMLYSAVLSAGAIPVSLGIVEDTEMHIKRTLMNNLSFDMLITSGGVSIGEYDFVKKAFKEIGCEMKFWKVAIKPGKPFAFGLLRGVPLFGLPGNPVSSYVAFEVFVRPAIQKMLGMKKIFRKPLIARMREGFKNKPGRMHFVRAIVKRESNGSLLVKPSGEQGSAMLSSLAKANCLIVIPAEKGDLKKDEEVSLLLFDDSILWTDSFELK